MSDNLTKNVLLVGTGPMAVDYFKVLNELNCKVTVVGRGEISSNKFEEMTGHKPMTGGIQKFLEEGNCEFGKAIVAVGMEALKETSIQLIDFGIKSLLVEKPAGLNFEEITDLADFSKKKEADVFVAYNRRFYASVQKAKKIIEEDGGVTSFNFEFTEWSLVIEKLEKASGVKENWFLGNSTHVVDLAFYLGGRPNEISCYTSGGLNWHPKASVFSGAGVSENGALFSYQANWEAPGRWSLEIITKKHRLILRPLEKLQIQKIGRINTDFVELNDELDSKFKPGLYLQTKAFLQSENDSLLKINEHLKNCRYYAKIIENEN